MPEERYACPCCGYLTMMNEPPGTFDVCPVCLWEDDDVQYRNPTVSGGANTISLEQAKKNFLSFAAMMPKFQEHVRAPLPDEIP